MTDVSNHKFQVIHFILRDVRFCMEIKYIEKILPLVMIEEVPNSPPSIAGLMNHAGQSVPVLDLAVLLGFKRLECYSLNAPILLCSNEKRIAGLIVDQVVSLGDVSSEATQMKTEFSAKDSLFKAAITAGTEVALLINTDEVLNFKLVLQHDIAS